MIRKAINLALISTVAFTAPSVASQTVALISPNLPVPTSTQQGNAIEQAKAAFGEYVKLRQGSLSTFVQILDDSAVVEYEFPVTGTSFKIEGSEAIARFVQRLARFDQWEAGSAEYFPTAYSNIVFIQYELTGNSAANKVGATKPIIVMEFAQGKVVHMRELTPAIAPVQAAVAEASKVN